MSELLTTGQVIDRLKRGEVDESCDGHTIARCAHGEIVMVDENNHLYASNVVLVEPFLKTKWRILPNYVSFEEAMKALKGGKKVVLEEHEDGDRWAFKPDEYKDNYSLEGFSLQELFEGKWTIEEEN
ncbi:hypothetical protein [Oceanobacillus profundus]|uniref:hypothetical protein n=1 Tax=Oceanobacillus profundus TaxID=372463 RepID=UPI0026E270A7|nr:hypothetical protein [Oceanobacillus profundus]MDO6451735.1 hypothetical protein [Oceanobacillus profundus]